MRLFDDPVYAASLVHGMELDDPKARAILNAADFGDTYPIVGADGCYTGGIVAADESWWWIVDDIAKISDDDARSGGWQTDRDLGHAWLE